VVSRMGPAAIRSMKRAPPPPPPPQPSPPREPVQPEPPVIVAEIAEPVPPPPPAQTVRQPTVRVDVSEVRNGYAIIKTAPPPADEQIVLPPLGKMADRILEAANERRRQMEVKLEPPPAQANGMVPVESLLGNAALLKRYKYQFLGGADDAQGAEKCIDDFIGFLVKILSERAAENLIRAILRKAKYALLGAEEDINQQEDAAVLDKFLLHVASKATEIAH